MIDAHVRSAVHDERVPVAVEVGRLRYRMYRHPLVMFGFGPAHPFFLLPATSPADRTDARRLEALAQPDGDQSGDCAGRNRYDPGRGLGSISAVHLPITLIGASPGCSTSSTSSSTRFGPWKRSGPARGRSLWQFTLRPSEYPALVHSENWPPPCPPSLQPTSVLPLDARTLPASQSFTCVRRVLWDDTSGRLITFRKLQNRLNSGALECTV